MSKAQQLALTVIYFSPLQAIFWYGQPLDYTNKDEIEFFKYVPMVWDESHYTAGEIRQNIAVARRKDNTWYVGLAAGLEDWQHTLTSIKAKLILLQYMKTMSREVFIRGHWP
ncbi:hypothetical protein GO493_10970 [Chitinophaga sp. ysch24]|uniref:Glycosyl-hydrolase 97 C-terminal oligomerisation domain-containing protein n=1 Tax=Chitinophaga tropicalis TaxID=2683588 RepID=A0A7K1U341_9BACT|nr:hypothetical protein [Chitinophaga tropicalis]